MITVSAPGKLMLLGEHGVVYGYPCLVTAVDRRLTVSIEQTDDGKITIDAPGSNDTRFVSEALQQGLTAWNITHKGLHIVTKSELGNYGLGSSAAVVVSTLKALAVLVGKEVNSRALFELGHRVVKAVQGVASGFDVAAAVGGQTVYFAEAGRVIEPIEIPDLPLVVAYSGAKADTVSLIASVAEKKRHYRERVERIFQSIGKLVEQAREALFAKDWEKFGKYMNFNQEYLRDLGVSTEKLEALITAAQAAGALGAKLSGAGGGDCIIVVATRDKRWEIGKALEQAGGEVIDVMPNAEGVRLETTDDQSELFTVVDENDTIIGYKTRAECHRDPNLLHRTIGVVVFDDVGRILLQKRSTTKDKGASLWGISCGGHVLKGETYEQAAAREVGEELGVMLSVVFVGKWLIDTGDEREMSAIYKAVSTGPFRPNKDEVAQIEWVQPKELSRKMLSREIKLTDWSHRVLHHTEVLQ